jgi:hypothetical protein
MHPARLAQNHNDMQLAVRRAVNGYDDCGVDHGYNVLPLLGG